MLCSVSDGGGDGWCPWLVQALWRMGRDESLRADLMTIVDDVVASMTAHCSDAGVALQGLAFLMGLSGTAANQVPLLRAVDTAMAALANHMATSAIADYSLGFLMNESNQASSTVRVCAIPWECVLWQVRATRTQSVGIAAAAWW